MRLLKLFIPFFLAASFTSCDTLFGNKNNEPNYELETARAPSDKTVFNGDSLIFIPVGYEEGSPEEYDLPEFISQVQDNQIIVNGYYLAASSFTPDGNFQDDEQSINVIIYPATHDDEAPSMPYGYFYDVYIQNLSEGRYTVNIIHKNDLLISETDTPDTVFSKQFTID